MAAYHASNRFRGGEELLDELVPDILSLLATRPTPFDAVLDWVCERAEADYEWLTPFMQDPEHRRMSLGWDLETLGRILGWAGIAERLGAGVEPDPYGFDRLIGGTLQLTTVGRWWLAAP